VLENNKHSYALSAQTLSNVLSAGEIYRHAHFSKWTFAIPLTPEGGQIGDNG